MAARNLLSRGSYDRDAPEYEQIPTEGTLPDDALLERDRRTSIASDFSDHRSVNSVDYDVLREEEQREKLLSRNPFGSLGINAGVKVGKKVKGRRKRRPDDVASMMGGKRLGMEEGGEFGIGSGDDFYSSDEEDYELDEKFVHKPRKPSVRKILVFSSLLLAFLLVLIFISLTLSRHTSSSAAAVFSNGTHLFGPTTILISLDGFRADFLNRHLTPTLQSFVDSGVSPGYMLPSFPSVTFPNHWTLATGLLPEAHGIVGNAFFSPALNRSFYYTDPARSMQAEWWGGEPVWMTAEKNNLKAAVHMWPGSEAPGRGSSILDKFNGSETLENKYSRVLELLDIADSKTRPNLVAMYVPNVDSAGHKFGPNSTETDTAIKSVDTMLGSLFSGLEARNRTEITNIVIVSDHGMATTSTDRLIYFDDLVDPKLIEHIDGWPLFGLRPYNSEDVEKIYDTIKSHHRPGESKWDVYLRDKNMPTRYHFSQNERIAPLWIIPHTGWAIITRKEFPTKPKKYHPKGIHGYDNQHPLMRALFVARGPAFRRLHGPGKAWIKGNKAQKGGEVRKGTVKPFRNTEVYNLICGSLGIQPPKGTNGTLTIKKLRLIEEKQPQDKDHAGSDSGTDSDSDSDSDDDGEKSGHKAPTKTATPASTTTAKPKVGVTIPDAPAPDRPTIADGSKMENGESKGEGDDQKAEDGEEDTLSSWLTYLKWRAQKLRESMEHWWGDVWDGSR
ncbi:Phosphodiest-domain-containing protein [Ascodesmis nigricans]|uniref:Phosphodiest-domain-containing protein n=1 Tax=Ascodesmis nigricans TaxID=341454 RepID=A0A4S2N021_9PEZI|nr:Phosphodiest-domain-containing protein [Ascodesmis nigricans]